MPIWNTLSDSKLTAIIDAHTFTTRNIVNKLNKVPENSTLQEKQLKTKQKNFVRRFFYTAFVNHHTISI